MIGLYVNTGHLLYVGTLARTQNTIKLITWAYQHKHGYMSMPAQTWVHEHISPNMSTWAYELKHDYLGIPAQQEYMSISAQAWLYEHTSPNMSTWVYQPKHDYKRHISPICGCSTVLDDRALFLVVWDWEACFVLGAMTGTPKGGWIGHCLTQSPILANPNPETVIVALIEITEGIMTHSLS